MRSKEHKAAQINEKKLLEQNSGADVDAKRIANSNRRAVQVLKTLSSLLPNSNLWKCKYIVDKIKFFFVCSMDKTRN